MTARSDDPQKRTETDNECAVSVLQLAAEIAAVWHEQDTIEMAQLEPRKNQLADTSPLETRMQAAFARQCALEDRVATMRARNTAEAAIQAALAFAALEAAEDGTEGDTAPHVTKAGRLLESVLLELVRESRIDPIRYALDRYAGHVLAQERRRR